MLRLIQLKQNRERRVALVREPQICLLDAAITSVYGLAQMALTGGTRMEELISAACRESVPYDRFTTGSQTGASCLHWIIQLSRARVCVAGTGLTHLGSAKSRNAMHGKDDKEKEKALPPETDSMKMFRWGVEGGKPEAGKVGIAPEWFYKGNGAVLRAHNEPLTPLPPSHSERP